MPAHELILLRDLLIVVAIAVPVVAAAQRVRVPNVVGFLLAGVLAGPQALGLVHDVEEVAGIAELGVVLLLFTIGLELSLSRITRMARDVLQGGLLQLLATMGLVTAIAAAVGLPMDRSVFHGALVALSSTAVVLKVYADRGELDSPHGRVAVSILLFQDLAVVPLMLLAPLLAGRGEGVAQMAGRVGGSLLVVAVVLVGGRLVVPPILDRIVGTRNREVFTLCVMLFGLGAAYCTASFGLSLALGAFLAGLVLSESEYGLQALSDVLPFRDTFSGIFFISVGMLLDLAFIVEHPLLVLGVTGGVIVLKAVVASGAVLSLRRPVSVALRSGLGLAQVGEFSFVLALAGRSFAIITPEGYQVFLATSVLTILLAPMLIAGSRHLARGWQSVTAERSAGEVSFDGQAAAASLDDHVIIVGFGLSGRNLARVLRAAGIRYVVLEQNGQTVHEARAAGEPIHFGDGTRPEVLERLGIERARVLVFAIASPGDELRGVVTARRLSDAVRIVVRTRYVASIERLLAMGADEVIPEEFETSIEIFARVLRLYGVPRNVIRREVDAVRGEAYEMLRGLDLPDLELDALEHLGVHGALDTILVEPEAPAVQQSPVSLELRRRTGASVIAVVREGKPLTTPDPEFRFRAGDTVVLVGDRESLERSADLFRTPRGRSGQAT